MIYWTREVAGWLLVGIGLVIFYLMYFELLLRGKIFEAGPTAFAGFIVFRGGIHLLKVAVAARVASQAAAEARQKPRPEPATPPRRPLPGVPARGGNGAR